MKSVLTVIVSMLVISVATACRVPNQSNNGVKSLEELSGLNSHHPECAGDYAGFPESAAKRLLAENAQTVAKPIRGAIDQFFSAIPHPLQKFFLDKNGFILTVDDPIAFASKFPKNVLEPVDESYLDESLVVFFDYRGAKKNNVASVIKMPAAEMPDYMFILVLKDDEGSIKRSGVRGFASFLLQAPQKLNLRDVFAAYKTPMANAFLKEVLVTQKNALLHMKGLIGEKAPEELAASSEEPLTRLSYLNANADNAERFKLAVALHSFDSLLCSAGTAKSEAFKATLGLADKALNEFLRSLGSLGLAQGDDDETFGSLFYRDAFSYSIIQQWQNSFAQFSYDYASQFAGSVLQPSQTINLGPGMYEGDVKLPD